MGKITDIDNAAVVAALAADPELEEQLHPLLDGHFGCEARQLVLAFLSARIEQGGSASGSLIPALADAMRAARDDFDA